MGGPPSSMSSAYMRGGKPREEHGRERAGQRNPDMSQARHQSQKLEEMGKVPPEAS